MKLNNESKIECPFADEILSYIYDEIDAAERTKFEDHLVGCYVCTDDFAAVSEARFSTFEWRREEFAHLPTPEIVIPYAAGSREAERSRLGFLEGIQTFLSHFTSPAAAVAASIIILLGIGLAMLRYVGPSDNSVASIALTPSVGIHESTMDNQSITGQTSSELSSNRSMETTKVPVVRTKASNIAVRPVRVAVHRPGVSGTRLVADNPPKQPVVQSPSNAPVLNNYEDTNDSSLRLADLFADIDG